jgi:DNA-binding MarR family transcriptional regulator
VKRRLADALYRLALRVDPSLCDYVRLTPHGEQLLRELEAEFIAERLPRRVYPMQEAELRDVTRIGNVESITSAQSFGRGEPLSFRKPRG